MNKYAVVHRELTPLETASINYHVLQRLAFDLGADITSTPKENQVCIHVDVESVPFILDVNIVNNCVKSTRSNQCKVLRNVEGSCKMKVSLSHHDIDDRTQEVIVPIVPLNSLVKSSEDDLRLYENLRYNENHDSRISAINYLVRSKKVKRGRQSSSVIDLMSTISSYPVEMIKDMLSCLDQAIAISTLEQLDDEEFSGDKTDLLVEIPGVGYASVNGEDNIVIYTINSSGTYEQLMKDLIRKSESALDTVIHRNKQHIISYEKVLKDE